MTASSHRQLLVRCEVINREGEAGIRFVERAHFRMWQYLMANKHNLRVRNAGISLWLPETEWPQHASLFSRAGLVEDVRRLLLSSFDVETSLCNTTQRFVPASDAGQLERLLVNRLPAEIRDTGDYVLEWEPGRAVLREGPDDLSTIGRLLGDQFDLLEDRLLTRDP